MKRWFNLVKSHSLAFTIGTVVTVLVGVTLIGFASQTPEKPLDYINVEETFLEVKVGEEYSLTYDSSLADPFLTWESSDLSKAKVVAGIIEPLEPGQVTITVHARNGSLRDEVSLIVDPAPFEVRIGDVTVSFLEPVSLDDLTLEIPEGMNFEGFFIDESLSQPYLHETVDSDITLYPKFTPIPPVVEMITVEWVKPDESVEVLSVEKGTPLEIIIQDLNINDVLVMDTNDACPDVLTNEFVINAPVKLSSWTEDDLPCEITESSFVVEGNLMVGQVIHLKAVNPEVTFSLSWEGLDRVVSTGALELVDGDEGKIISVKIQGTGEYHGEVTLNVGTVGAITPPEDEDSSEPETEAPEMTPPPLSDEDDSVTPPPTQPTPPSRPTPSDPTPSEPTADKTPIEGLVITGDFKVGETIQAFISPSAATVTYQWFISENNRDFSIIPTATGSAYTITPDDHRHYLAVNVEGTGDYTGLLKQGTQRIELNQSPTLPQEDSITITLTIDSLSYIPIASADDLQAMNSTASHVFAEGTQYELTTNGGINKRYALINDIDLDAASWTPITSFSGLLDGQNHTIKNLTMLNNEGSLFNTLNGADIRNLTVSGFSIDGTDVGALAEFATGAITQLENILVTGSNVTGSSAVGGLIGRVDYSTTVISPAIETATGLITRSGLRVKNVTISSIIHSDLYAGGMIGQVEGLEHQIIIDGVETFGSVTGEIFVGGIIGLISDLGVSIRLEKTINHAILHQTSIGIFESVGGLIGLVGNELTTQGAISIFQSSNYGNITASSNAGGLIGHMFGLRKAEISESFDHSNIQSTYDDSLPRNDKVYLGGLVGSVSNTEELNINNSYVLNTIVINEYLSSNEVGGLIGLLNGDHLTTVSSIQNNYAVSVMRNETNLLTASALFGTLSDSNAYLSINHVYYSDQYQDFASVNENSTPITGGSIQDLFDANKYQGFELSDFQTHSQETWKMNSQNHKTMPYLAWQDIPLKDQEREWYFINYLGYLPISSAEELQTMINSGEKVFGNGTEYQTTISSYMYARYENFILTQDIDMTGFNFSPIGDSSNPFLSIFDGNFKTIHSLNLDKDTSGGDGLFSNVDNGTIRNLNLNQPFSSGATGIGFITGYAKGDSKFENITILDGIIGGNFLTVGGLIGSILDNSNIQIFNSQVHAQIEGHSGVGGLIGSTSNTRSISIVISQSSVIGNLKSSIGLGGGLVGETYGDLTVNDSFHIGTITNNGDHAGGLIGLIRGGTHVTLSSVYHAGDFLGTGNNNGGLVGTFGVNNDSSMLTVSKSYSYVGYIDPNLSNNGGILAIDDSSNNPSFLKNFYLTQASIDRVFDSSNNQALTDSSIRDLNTYNTWSIADESSLDSSKIWWMEGGITTPYHAWYVQMNDADFKESLLLASGFIPLKNSQDLINIDASVATSFAVSTSYETRLITPSAQSNFIMVNDIDLNGIPFTPTALFSGIFHGQNHSIQNLTINDPDGNLNEGGFFAKVSSGTIQNITFNSVNITGGVGNRGVLAGEVRGDSVIRNIQIIGESNLYVYSSSGGLIGRLRGTGAPGSLELSNILINVTLSAVAEHTGNSLGGLIGYYHTSSEPMTVTMESIHVMSTIVSNMSDLGGLIGYVNGHDSQYDTLHMQNLTVSAILKSPAWLPDQAFEYVGGLIGKINDIDALNIQNISINSDIDYDHDVGYLGGIIGEIINTDLSIDNLNQHNEIYIQFNYSQVFDAYFGGLIGLMEDSHFLVTNSSVSNDFNMPEPTYDCHHVGGVVGYVYTSSVTLSSMQVNNEVYAFSDCLGGVIGTVRGGYATTESSVFIDHLTHNGQLKGYGYVGGIVGFAGRITDFPGQNIVRIENVHQSATISAILQDFGTDFAGVIGRAYSDVIINNVTQSGNISGRQRVAGIIANSRFTNTAITLSSVIQNGNIKAEDDFAGGLIAFNGGSPLFIEQITMTGLITVPNGNASEYGGLIGHLQDSNVSVSQAYISVSISALNSASIINKVGGIVGEAETSIITLNAIKLDDTHIDAHYYIGGLIGEGNSISLAMNDIDINQLTVDSTDISGGLVGILKNGVDSTWNVSITGDAIQLSGTIAAANSNPVLGSFLAYLDVNSANLTVNVTNFSNQSNISDTIGDDPNNSSESISIASN